MNLIVALGSAPAAPGFREQLAKFGIKFAIAFIPAFLGTGALLGILYVRIMRNIERRHGISRENVEEYLEKLRRRLKAAPIPIVEWAHPVMVAGLAAVYGASKQTRLRTSFFIGLLFTSIAFGVICWKYKQATPAVHQMKAKLERDIDPKLYMYATDPALNSEFKKAGEKLVIEVGYGYSEEWIYPHGIYEELRTRAGNFEPVLLKRLFASPNRTELMPLFLIEGTCINPGIQWKDSIFLFLFNVLVDFLSVTVIMASLEFVGRKLSLRRAMSAFICALMGTLVCAIVSFLSYRLFFRGDIGLFVRLLFILPLSLGGVAFGIISVGLLVIALLERKVESALWGILFLGLFFSFLGFLGLSDMWGYARSTSLGLISWRDLFSLPYVLATTNLIPATLTLLCFCIVLAVKVTAEPARVLTELWMTYFSEEGGSRHAYNIIGLISTVAGVLAGVLLQ